MMKQGAAVIACMMKPLFIRTVALLAVLAAGCPALTINLGNDHERDRREARERREEHDRYARRRSRPERHRRRENSSGWEKLLRDELPKPARR